MRIFQLDGICRSLSPRQLEVLHHTIAGERAKEIARALEIDFRTVESHQIHIRKKLGARTNIDMVRIALRGRGL